MNILLLIGMFILTFILGVILGSARDNGRRCKKCNAFNSTVKWHAASTPECPGSEHLQFVCRECGFMWATSTYDKV